MANHQEQNIKQMDELLLTLNEMRVSIPKKN